MSITTDARTVAREVDRRLVSWLHRRTVQMRNPRPVVTFTFDDFPQSAARDGASILEANGARGTFYLAADTVGEPQDLEQGAAVEADLIATAEHVEELAKAGHEIGCHAFEHVPLQGMNRHDVAEQCRRNHASGAGGGDDRRLTSFAYPLGRVSLTAKREASRRHASCRGLSVGINAGQADLGNLRSVGLRSSALDTTGVDRWLIEVSRVGGWLIFCSHDVRAAPSHWGVTPELLQYSVEQATRRGFDVLPMRSALGRIVYGGDA